VSPGFHALVVYRLGRFIHSDDRALLRWARPLYRLARAFIAGVYAIELPREAQIGRRLHLPHPHGVVVSGDAVIGDDCMLRHNVTIGAGSDTRGGYPTIGDRVTFGPGSIVMGAVHVGDDVMIGPGAVVVHDVAAGSRVLAPLATCRPPRAATAGPPSDSDLPSLDERADR
jgi:serine O-acetyltransferase